MPARHWWVRNLGAGKPDRAEQAIWIATRFNAIFLGVVGLAFVLGAGPLVRLFTDDPPVLERGHPRFVDSQPGVPVVCSRRRPHWSSCSAGHSWRRCRPRFLAAAVTSVVLERIFVPAAAPLASDLDQVLLTIGLAFISVSVAAYFFGTIQQPIETPAALRGSVDFLAPLVSANTGCS